MPQVPNFYLDFHVTGSERKRLVNAVSEHVGEDAHYLGAPSFAYQVNYFTINRTGCVSFDSRADSEEIEGLLEELSNQGFSPVSSNFGLPEDEEDSSNLVQESGVALEPDETSVPAVTQTTADPQPISPTQEEIETAKTPTTPTSNKPAETNEETASALSAESSDEAPAERTSEVTGLPVDIVNQLNSLRTTLIREINRHFDRLLRASNADAPRPRTQQAYTQRAAGVVMAPSETASIPLCGDISTLRGTKPVMVRCSEEAIPAVSWKQVTSIVLDICNRQKACHQALLQARNNVVGRGRKFLSDSPQGMYSPLKIDEELYMESNFSTEALLKLLRDRILNKIGFDASSITLEYRRP